MLTRGNYQAGGAGSNTRAAGSSDWSWAAHADRVLRTCLSSFLGLLLPFACVGPVVDIPPGQAGSEYRDGECDPGSTCSEAGLCYDDLGGRSLRPAPAA